MRNLLRALLMKLWRLTTPPRPPVDHSGENAALHKILEAMMARLTPDESNAFFRFREMASDLIEARLMCGGGPSMGFPGAALISEANRTLLRIQECALGGLREGPPVSGMGAFGDIELALQNVDWRREINMSWLEFSRWGIQQIILISRLYYIKQPLMRRAVDVVAAYVFGRGVEISSTDDDANDTLNEFYERNRAVFGPIARLGNQRTLSTDGNLFIALFADKLDSGKTTARKIDATEIQDIITDPNDSETEMYFKRVWTAREFDEVNGTPRMVTHACWYPALEFERPEGAPDAFGQDPIRWDSPVIHGKHGGIAGFRFGCPEGYPALEWIKTAARYLQSCATLAASHAQIAWDVTTKGGQAAIQGTKQQLQTQVNSAPGTQMWDSNPTAVTGSILAKGPGSEWKMVNSRGQGLDPKEGLTYNIYVGNVFGVPPTWLGDMETANLSTATTLDRPTELGMRARQMWWEDFDTRIAMFVLKVSAGAASGQLREALNGRKIGKVVCIEAPRKTLPNGRRVYDEAKKPKANEIHVRVTFPAIREGDLPQIVKAITEALTLDNKGGQIVGIDVREGLRLLYEAFGVENPEELIDKQYPLTGENKYDPNRMNQPVAMPIGNALPPAGGKPVDPNAPPEDKPVKTATEAQVSGLAALVEAVRKKKYTSKLAIDDYSDTYQIGTY